MDQEIKNVGVIGDGSWATAIVKLLYENNHKVRWWVRLAEDVKYIKDYGFNPHYLSGVSIPKRLVKPSNRVKNVVEASDVVIIAVPAAYVMGALSQLPKDAFDGKLVVTAVKGMIPEEHLLVTQVLERDFGVGNDRLSIVSGPCHAEEVAMGRQSYLTIGSENPDVGEVVASLLRGRYIKVNVLNDLMGIELSAVMKNIIAIACGMANGLNFGDNFQAVLVSNAMQEISRFLDAVDPKTRDVNASAYLGDLLVTTYSSFSRNRTLGNMVGRGYTVKSAMMEMRMVAEGYYAVASIKKIMDEKGIDLAICRSVYHILYDKISPSIELQLLKDKLV